MVKKRIVSFMLLAMSVTLLAPTVSIKKLQLNSKPKQLAESVEILDLKDYKLKQVEEVFRVQIQKREEMKAREIEEQKRIEESKKQYWKFEVSYYCGCHYCTQNGNLITASGEYAQEGITIALPHDIPFGSQVHIDNVGDFTVQDRGGYIGYTYDEEGSLIMRTDIYISDHNRALQLGRHIESGYIIIN